MIRAALILLFVFLAQTANPSSTLDPAFEKVPFDKWLTESAQAPFRWTVNVPRAELSFHQRLSTAVQIELDGRDLTDRRTHGSLAFLIQITDHNGARYQNHGDLDLAKVDENIKAANIEYSQRAFFLPGEYKLALAVLDTGTGEHSTRQTQFRVPPPSRDFPADAWRGLPTVEFVGKEDTPDSWFLPEVQGRLKWASAIHSPAQINVILNVSPHRTHSADLAAFLPTVKVISETGSPAITEHVELIDLARRRAAFDQKDVHDLDWPRFKDSLTDSNTASIDVHSLSERHHDAQFFVAQIRSVIRDSKTPCVLVVLTPPVAFERGEDVQPISLEALPACRLIYVRYRAPVQRSAPVYPTFGPRGRARMGGPVSDQRPPNMLDELEATLKPLNPKVFDVSNAEQMTKALVEMERSLSVSAP